MFARRVLDNDDETVLPLLRELWSALHVALSAHLDLEDVILAPALRETDAYGPDRADELLVHHAEQREMLARALERAKDPQTTAVDLARDSQRLVEYLMHDMAQEDRDLLNPNLLRDDIINVGFTG